MTDSSFAHLKNLPKARQLAGGTPMCAGCGGLQVLHQVLDVLGENTVLINAAGCMTLLANYPYTPLRGSWLYTAMASAPAGAQGVRDALDILLERGLPKEQDLTVVVLSGDGAAGGIGLSAASAAIERGLDFIYLVYDNEGYGNTGQQQSASTPHGARTATCRDLRGWKKDLFAIWTAHRPTYAATLIGSEPLDLARKVEKAATLKGPRLLLALAPCPTGWDFDPAETTEIGRLAVRSGIWPLKEYADGRVTHTRAPHDRLPVEDYLSRQGRFRHLFEPQRDAVQLGEIQAAVDTYWNEIRDY
jgi:pyruvate ferredoxin oxidoreductase beta subunit